MVPIQGDAEPKVLVQTSFVEGSASFSPDGRWITYQGFDTGSALHYLRRADGSGSRLTVSGAAADADSPRSRAGDTRARWSRDGRQFFAVEHLPHIMTARDFHPDGTVSAARRLFDYRYHYDFDVAPDGRFLVVLEAEPPTLVFVESWFAELVALFPTAND
jgi:hypothetical protein